MKLLLVGTNPENTGAATHFVALAQAMADAGHEVDAVLHPAGLMWHGLADSGVRRHRGRFRNAFDLRGYAAVFNAARAQRPDWLVGNFGKEYWPLLLLGYLLGIKVALFRHRTPPMKAFSQRWVPRLAQRFFAVSEHARQAYLDRGVPPDRVQVLYNPVDPLRYRPDPAQSAEIRRQQGIPADAVVLGYAGRMHAGKGIFPLLEAASAAMREQPRLHCLWLGDGPDAGALRQRIAAASDLAGRHHWVGWTNAPAPWYRAMSMLAFPSIATETFGRVSIEAQASGVPVLGSDIGGIPETMRAGETGLLLPRGDVAAWREAILALCDDARRASMADAAVAFAGQHFAGAVIAERFVQLLQSAPDSAHVAALARGVRALPWWPRTLRKQR